MTTKHKRARKPRDLWPFEGEAAGALCIEEPDGQRVVVTHSTYMMGPKPTAKFITWLQRALVWQKDEKR